MRRIPHFHCSAASLLVVLILAVAGIPQIANAAAPGVPVAYQLPTDGPLPKTYLVTLAITDAADPNWIVSTFVAGQPRTVTAENQGRFTETWDGLDENFMPVPPGDYDVKGIYSAAAKWKVDGEWHAIHAQYVTAFTAFYPKPNRENYWTLPIPFNGDPVNQPFRDIDVGPNGVAAFYYQYLENGKNIALFDLNKPLGFDQYMRAFNSGGAAGGPVIATDGVTAWAYSEDGGPDFVYRADGRPFGKDNGANRRNVLIPTGAVSSMAAWRDPEAGNALVYVAQRGTLMYEAPAKNRKYEREYESTDHFVNLITIHDGADGKQVAQVAVDRPQAIVVRQGRLIALHRRGDAWQVSALPLTRGMPAGEWQRVFAVPSSISPFDLEVDNSGRYYLSDSAANKVYQLDATGKVTRRFGRLPAQQPGSYDPLTLMAPERLATWTDADGQDRLIICEAAGPNRAAEWSANTGELLRTYMPFQTKANNGYAIDPANPSHLYLPGQRGWLLRFKLNYETGDWPVDAVWPDVEAGQRRGLDKPVAIRANGTLYLASEQNLTVYRLDATANRWLQSAAIIQKGEDRFFWHDANGNGEIEEEADGGLRPANLPARVLTYHGQKWLPDFSYLAMGQGSQSLYRLAPARFDAHGNPVFTAWETVLTDPVFAARSAGTADAVHGGNELATTYNSDWMQADGSMAEGFYIHARGGKSFTANFGAQYKITRYVPDGEGGYRIVWRAGRAKLGSARRRGELEGGMRLFQPINGILTVVDQSRSGLSLYTDDGLFVDNVFTSGGFRGEEGVYRQPGEFFAGTVYANPENGKIYYAGGKYTPFIYELRQWSMNENPVRRLTDLPPTVRITASQIADPPPIAISLRGEAGVVSVSRFRPALGGVALDGSLKGWEGAEPVEYRSGDDQGVSVRCLYDPDTLHLRWHVRLGATVEQKVLPPLERIFTHDYETDTVSFYIQGDVNAPPGDGKAARPGDVRMVFGLFTQNGKLNPVAVGMYPAWPGQNGKPQTYRTPVGDAQFAHVGAVEGAKLGYALDPDGKGFVIAASIPRQAIPAIRTAFSGDYRTLVNYSANLGGHNKFWWANRDGSASTDTYDEPSEARLYPGSWAPAQFDGIENGAVVRHWQILGPFGGPGVERFKPDPQNKEEVSAYFEKATYPPDGGKVDLAATYSGEMITGYWGGRGTIRWHEAEINTLDTRVQLGLGSQVWYGATWIHAPEATDVEFELQGHRMTHVRWRLNGTLIPVKETDYHDNEYLSRRTASRKVTLKAGWNEVFFRSYNVGYVPVKLGLIVKAEPAKLWPLTFAVTPQQPPATAP